MNPGIIGAVAGNQATQSAFGSGGSWEVMLFGLVVGLLFCGAVALIIWDEMR